MATNYPEQFNLDAFKNGDHEEFKKIVLKYCSKVKLFAGTFLPIKEDIEDVIQEVFEALQKADKTRFKSLEHIKNFLYKATKHKSISLKRKNKPAPLDTYELQDLADQPLKLVDELKIKYAERGFWEDIARYSAKLEPEIRDTLFYFYKEDIPAREIAALTNVAENTVYYRLEIAISHLRKLIDSRGGRIGLFVLSVLCLALIFKKICFLFGI